MSLSLLRDVLNTLGMLTARLSVRFPGDWTETIGELGVHGDIYTATLHKRHYMGLIRLHGERVSDALELVRRADYHTSVQVVEHRQRRGDERATVHVTAELKEDTPFLVMLENGYMPLDPTVLRDGREYFDLVLQDRERFMKLVDSLDTVGEVEIKQVIRQVKTPAQPSPVAWNSLQEDLTARQIEVLALAVDQGYFRVPHEVELAELAAELDLQKSTVSEHLRRGLGHITEFVIREMDST